MLNTPVNFKSIIYLMVFCHSISLYFFYFLDDEKLSESSKEQKTALVKTCKHIFADKYGKDWNKSVL